MLRFAMNEARRTIVEVIKTIRKSEGDEVAAVRCSDGKCGVTWNGHLLQSIEWRADQLDDCLAFLERFSRTTSFPNESAEGASDAASSF
jgi:hypothetical protein